LAHYAKRPTTQQLEIVLQRLMPREFEARGIEDAQSICDGLAARMGEFAVDGDPSDSPEDGFERISG